MTDCRNCTRPTDLYLCNDCTEQLTDMLEQLPWLLDELDARIQRLDRTNIGTIGRNRRPDELNVMDFDAAETARNTEKALRDLVATINGPGPIRLQCTVTHEFIGPLRPAWRRLPHSYKPTLIELIDWLMRRVNTIARHPKAGHVYRELRRLVGPGQRGGQLVRAINPVEHHLVGPCPTITGRDHQGHPRQCGHILFADTYDRTVTCPTCEQDIDVEATRRQAAAARDLHTRQDLLDVLANIDEPTNDNQLTAWITARRLRPAGWIHDGTITEYRIHPAAEPVYSLNRARRLRRRDHDLTRRKPSDAHS
jgi:uncharacterized Zn finger protein (UPF0148 family)